MFLEATLTFHGVSNFCHLQPCDHDSIPNHLTYRCLVQQTNRLKNTVSAFLCSIRRDSKIMSLLRSSSPPCQCSMRAIIYKRALPFSENQRVRMLTWKLQGDCSACESRIWKHFVCRHAFSINQSLQIHVRTLTVSRFNLLDTNSHISAMVFV